MDADELAICDFLRSWPRQFVATREICRRAGGTQRFREDPYWANQAILRLVEKGLLERDAAGHCRLAEPKEKKKGAKWVSPQIKQILKQSGKGFEEEMDLGDPDDYIDEKG